MVENMGSVLIVVPCFVIFMAGLVAWKRRRPVQVDQVEAAEKAAKRAWTQYMRAHEKNRNGPVTADRIAVEPAPTPAPPKPGQVFYADPDGPMPREITAGPIMRGDAVKLVGTSTESMRDVLVDLGTVRMLQRGETLEQVRVMPVVLLTELFDRATRMRIEHHERHELLEWAWVAESDHAPETLRVGGSGAMKALAMLTHAMVREKQLPEEGPRRVMVRVRTVKNAVAEFEVDVNEPTWMVKMAVLLRDLE